MNTKVDECKLISGKDALIALANGKSVEYMNTSDTYENLGWSNAFGLGTNLFFLDRFKFRLKPPTIRLSLEIPAPFKPKEGESFFTISAGSLNGYFEAEHSSYITSEWFTQFGTWRTEDEIKQVVAALRRVLGGSHD